VTRLHYAVARLNRNIAPEVPARRAKRMTKLPMNVRDWPLIWKELYEERAGIMAADGWTRGEAEILAEEDIRKIAAKAA